MTTKTTLLSLTGGLVLAAAMLATPATADPDRRGDHDAPSYRKHHDDRDLSRVTAMGAGPNAFVARREAVHAWRDKVANRYGDVFSHWSSARDKDVDCRRVADDDPSWDSYGKRAMKPEYRRHYEPVSQCVISAVPSKGWRTWFGR